MAGDEPRYDAFISYSHRADDDLAPSLHAGLQRLAKPWYRRRQMRVFLDRTSMSADPALWGAIQRALDSSKGFVLLMAPASASSPWVQREIEHWVAAHGSERLLPVLTDGELVWDAAAKRFDPVRSTAAPAALEGVFTEEPRWIDLRWTEGAPGSLLTLRDPRFLDAVAEIAAPIRGVNKDELVGNDLAEHRRTVRIARAAVATLSVLLVVALVAASLAVANARRAERRRLDAQSARIRLEATTVSVLPDTGFLLAAEAYRLQPGSTTANVVIAASQRAPDLRRYVRAHRAAIVGVAFDAASKVLVSYDRSGSLVASDAATGATLRTARASANGAGLVATPSGVVVVGLATIELRDPATLAVRRTWRSDATPFAGAVVLGDQLVLARIDGTIAVTPLAGGSGSALTWTQLRETSLYAISSAPDGSLVTVGESAGQESSTWSVARLDLAPDGAATQRWRTELRGVPAAVAVNAPGDTVAVGVGATVSLFDAATGKLTGRLGVSGTVTAFAASPALPDYLLTTLRDGSVSYVQPVGGLVFPEHLHGGAATAITWTADGRAATGDSEGVVALLDTGPNRLLGGWLVPQNVRAVTVGRTPGTVIASLVDGTLEQLTFKKGSAHINTKQLGTFANVTAVADLGTSVVVGTTTGELRVVAPSGRAGPVVVAGAGAAIVALEMSASGLIVSRTATGYLQTWRVDGDRLVLVRTISDAALAQAVSRDGGRDVVAYFESRVGVLVADAATGVETARYPRTVESTVIAIAPDATTVAVADGGDVKVLRADGTTTTLAAGGEVAGLAFVDGGQRVIAANGASGARLLDVATGTAAGFIADEDRPATRTFATGANSDLVAIATSAGLRVVSFSPADVLAAGCAAFGRPFTAEELRRFDLARNAAPCEVVP